MATVTPKNDKEETEDDSKNERENKIEQEDETGKEKQIQVGNLLTRENLKYNFSVFQLYSKLQAYPFKVEKNGGNFYIPEESLWHSILFTFWRVLIFLQSIYSAVRCLQSLTMGEEFTSKNLHHLPVMIGNTTMSVAMNYQISNVANFWPNLNLKLANEFFLDKKKEKKETQPDEREVATVNVGEQEEKESDQKQQQRGAQGNGKKKKLTEMNQMELVLCLFPLLFNPIILTMPMLYITEPDLPILFCSILGEWRNVYTVGICFIFDFIIFELNGAYIHYIIYFNLSFIINFIHNTKQQIQKIRSKFEEVDTKLNDACKNLEVLKLRLNLFNVGFCGWVYVTKVGAMTMAIFAGFAAIRLMETNVHFAAMYFLMFLNAIIGYIGMFNFGFSIVDLLEELKVEIVKKSQGVTLPWKRMEIQKRVRAVPANMGIKMGRFHDLERNSTIIFVDFVSQQIVALLLAFP